MWKKIKVCWSILTSNSLTGYLSIGTTPEGRSDLMFSTYKPKVGKKVNYDKTIILPSGTIAYIPRLTEGRIETPEEYLSRIKGGKDELKTGTYKCSAVGETAIEKELKGGGEK